MRFITIIPWNSWRYPPWLPLVCWRGWWVGARCYTYPCQPVAGQVMNMRNVEGSRMRQSCQRWYSLQKWHLSEIIQRGKICKVKDEHVLQKCSSKMTPKVLYQSLDPKMWIHLNHFLTLICNTKIWGVNLVLNHLFQIHPHSDIWIIIPRGDCSCKLNLPGCVNHVCQANHMMTTSSIYFHHKRVPIFRSKKVSNTQIFGSSEPDPKNVQMTLISFIQYFWLRISLIWIFGSFEPHFNTNFWTLWYNQALMTQIVTVNIQKHDIYIWYRCWYRCRFIKEVWHIVIQIHIIISHCTDMDGVIFLYSTSMLPFIAITCYWLIHCFSQKVDLNLSEGFVDNSQH